MINYNFKQHFFRKCEGCDIKLQDGADGTYHSYFCDDLLKLRFRKMLGDCGKLCIEQALKQSKRNAIYFKEIFSKSNITELQIPVMKIIPKQEARQTYKDGHCKKCLCKVSGEMIFIHHLICRTSIMDTIEENLEYNFKTNQPQILFIEVVRKGDFYFESFLKFQKYIQKITNSMKKQKNRENQIDLLKKKLKHDSGI